MTGRFACIRVYRRKILSSMIKAVSAFALIILPFATVPAHAQVVVERSKDKAIIGGESYYIHVVKKGETAYSISRAYGITVDQLQHENPSTGVTLKEGMSLRIPVKIVTAAPAGQPVPYRHAIHNKDKFIYHILDKGETIFYLSRKYQVSEKEITEANPGLDVTKITLGSEIAIPRKIHEVVESVPLRVPVEGYQRKVHEVVEPVPASVSAEGYQHKVTS